ncbi:MAG TPA: hypothetical protein VEI97_02080 [bacterium]|nr:hypothetical protein [bacterium]
MALRTTTDKQFVALARIAAAATLDDQIALAAALQVAIDLGFPHEAGYETLLQLVPYVGYPRVVHAMVTMHANFPTYFSLRGERPSEPWAAHAVGTWPMRGEQIFIQLWGPEAWGRRNLSDLSPELGEWFIADTFGRIFGRPGLTLLEREVVVLGTLLAQGSFRELANHRRAIHHLGGPEELIDAVVEGVGDLILGQHLLAARETLAKLRLPPVSP